MDDDIRSPENLWKTLQDATQFDPSIELDRRHFPKMMKRHVSPVPYSKDNLFGGMLTDQPFILTDFPSPLRGPLAGTPKTESGETIIRWLGRHGNKDRHRLYVGPTGVRRDLDLKQIAIKWLAGQTRFGVTDLHIRNSNTENIIGPDTLSAFNLLNIAGEMASEQEMFSFVISSRGQVTDSHSDAPDSSNYCFTGQKLWLAWDTMRE